MKGVRISLMIEQFRALSLYLARYACHGLSAKLEFGKKQTHSTQTHIRIACASMEHNSCGQLLCPLQHGCAPAVMHGDWCCCRQNCRMLKQTDCSCDRQS